MAANFQISLWQLDWKTPSQYNVDGEPREGEENDNDEDEFDDALLVLDALGGGAASRLLYEEDKKRCEKRH